MRVLCRHGHFAFYPREATDVARFANYFNLTLVAEDDYYTFPILKALKPYSLIGFPNPILPAIAMFEGRKWDIMRENMWVYDLVTGLIVPKLLIPFVIDTPLSGYSYAPLVKMLQPGTRNLSGQQILSFSGEWDQNFQRFLLSEFSYE